ncbi:hypothetical protein GCM10010252_74790 [Streptomyces aureoverticillatus]|nr:hypothetical protein GCM10010252_74790 [Streptomyces aureoverticillatus]
MRRERGGGREGGVLRTAGGGGRGPGDHRTCALSSYARSARTRVADRYESESSPGRLRGVPEPSLSRPRRAMRPTVDGNTLRDRIPFDLTHDDPTTAHAAEESPG